MNMNAVTKHSTIVALVLLSSSTQAHAWGDLGHKVICEIAYRLVQPHTRDRIRNLIDRDTTYKTFADSCVYPDHPMPGQPRIRPQEHYINLPRDSQGLTSDQCPQADSCVLTAILNDEKVLSSKDANDAAHLVALKSLGHWVGDIHQPLHVSFLDDKGGNDIHTYGCAAKLHAVWDSCLVEESVGLDVSKAATVLEQSLKTDDKAKWAASSPRDWANETFAITESPATEYCIKLGSSCNPIDRRDMTITSAYVEVNKPIVKLQLQRAGVRLARLLDVAFHD